MTSRELQPALVRPSDAERDRALGILRDNAANGRLSPDTFMRRMEVALGTRDRDVLDELVQDLPVQGRMSRLIARLTDRLHTLASRVDRRLGGGGEGGLFGGAAPVLMLPRDGTAPLKVGRDPRSGLRLADETVSRTHAELFETGGVWMVRDLGSMNGTFINGRRVAGVAAVRPGDRVRFGRPVFRLVRDLGD